jgi:hypothetical protein
MRVLSQYLTTYLPDEDGWYVFCAYLGLYSDDRILQKKYAYLPNKGGDIFHRDGLYSYHRRRLCLHGVFEILISSGVLLICGINPRVTKPFLLYL